MIDFYYLSHVRPENLHSVATAISSLSDDMKSKINFTILASNVDARRPDYDDIMYDPNIKIPSKKLVDFAHFHSMNYPDKIAEMQRGSGDIVIKCDDDIYFNKDSFSKFMRDIEEVLSNPNIGIYTIPLSNGIPTCEIFLKHTLSPEKLNEVYQSFLDTLFGVIWDVDYRRLNYVVKDMNGTWNPDQFYDAVSKINHHYKGIHPVRINANAASRVNNAICEDLGNILNSGCFVQNKEYNFPYMCNSFFAMRRKDWNAAISDRSLYVDDFDEVPINKYLKNNNFKFMIQEGGKAIHIVYNTVPGHQLIYKNTMSFIRKLT